MESKYKSIIKKILNKVLSIVSTLSFYSLFARDVKAQTSWYIAEPLSAEPPSFWDMAFRLLGGVMLYIALPIVVIILIITKIKKTKKNDSNTEKSAEGTVD